MTPIFVLIAVLLIGATVAEWFEIPGYNAPEENR